MALANLSARVCREAVGTPVSADSLSIVVTQSRAHSQSFHFQVHGHVRSGSVESIEEDCFRSELSVVSQAHQKSRLFYYFFFERSASKVRNELLWKIARRFVSLFREMPRIKEQWP